MTETQDIGEQEYIVQYNRDGKVTYDLTNSIALVSDLVKSGHKCISIVGDAVSGKSGLAKALEHSGNDVELIDVAQLGWQTKFDFERPDISSYIKNQKCVVIDEWLLCDNSIHALSKLLQNGGIAVLISNLTPICIQQSGLSKEADFIIEKATIHLVWSKQTSLYINPFSNSN